MSTVVIATRSTNDELYKLSGELLDLPFERVRFTETSAEEYFYKITQLDADWVINLDEDVFVIDPTKILGLLEYMKQSNYVCCGVPDGGVIAIRFHNPVVPNAFFTIHHNKKIKERFDIAEIEQTSFSEELKRFTPHHLLRSDSYQYDEFEPYYNFFFWILGWGAILYLDAIQWTRDGTSTILTDHQKQPMLLHCWYGRDYLNQRERFDYAINFCREVRRQKERQ